MSKKANIISIIPARGGSKTIPKKNICIFNDHPLIAYSIIASKLSKRIERTIVSTDDEEIAEIAEKYGAEVPFLRPKEFARDDSPDIEFVRHAFDWLNENEDVKPEYMVHLRPIVPIRDPVVVDRAIGMIMRNKIATGLRAVYEFPQPICKMFKIEDGYLKGLCPDDPRPEYYNLPRQTFEPTYCPNSYVDVLRRSTLYNTSSLHGDKLLAFVVEDTGDIDTLEQFKITEALAKIKFKSILDMYDKEMS